MENKIAIIIPYFGSFPKWISLFVEGCRYNSFIDFILYSDCEYTFDCDNIFYNQISFKEFCYKISSNLNISFTPQSAYKLCGVRPFYGIIFKDELDRYDFWGFCDLDLVFGDLNLIFTEKRLKHYNVISTEGDRISGPLCILQNSKANNESCLKIKKWKEKLESDEFIPLDEKYLSDILAPELKILRGINSYFLRKLLPLKFAKRTFDLLSLPILLFLRFFKSQYYKEFNSTPEIGVHNMSYVYNRGKIFSLPDNKEIPYLHFLFYKKNKYRSLFLWDELTKVDTDELDYNKMIFIDESGIHN